MTKPVVGVSIQAFDGPDSAAQIRQAEAAGIAAAWATIGGAGGADVLTAFAVALEQTERILLGTAIVQTYPRHAITLAQQTVALEQFGPGRFRLAGRLIGAPVIHDQHIEDAHALHLARHAADHVADRHLFVQRRHRHQKVHAVRRQVARCLRRFGTAAWPRVAHDGSSIAAGPP